MFAYIQYHDQPEKTYFVPYHFVKDFNPETVKDFVQAKSYKIFWSLDLLKNQGNINELKEMTVPEKQLWDRDNGQKYYKAFILRLGASVEELVISVDQKRPSIPPNHFQPNKIDSSTDEDIEKRKCKLNKNQECKKDSYKERMRLLLGKALTDRKDLFVETNDTDEEAVLERDNLLLKINELEAECSRLQKENVELRCKASLAEKGHLAKIEELEEKNFLLSKESTEVEQLRLLNRNIQEKVLNVIAQGNTNTIVQNGSNGPEELPEDVELGSNIVLKRSVLNAVKAEGNISRFTKSLCVAIWGSDVLAQRSTKGMKCRNIKGCKRKVDGEEVREVEAKQKLTPEKLSAISSQMRLYMEEKKMDVMEIETNLKKRNRFISEKIADLNRSCRRTI